MLRSDTTLKTKEQFEAAMFYKTPVIVYQAGEAYNHGGIILSFDRLKVNIDGAYYIRPHCEFRVR